MCKTKFKTGDYVSATAIFNSIKFKGLNNLPTLPDFDEYGKELPYTYHHQY